MAVAYRSSTQTVGSSSLTGTEPAGVVADDILIACSYREDGLATATINPPAGWSNVFGPNTISALEAVTGTFSDWQSSWFWIRRGGSAPSYVWTAVGGTGYEQITIAAFSGAVNTGNPFSFAAAAVRDDTAAATYPNVSGTTDQANEMLVWYGTQLVGDSSFTVPSGFTTRWSNSNTDTVYGDKAQAAAGATGSVGSGAGPFAANDPAIAFLCGLSPTTVGGGATYVAPRLIIPNTAVHRASRW